MLAWTVLFAIVYGVIAVSSRNMSSSEQQHTFRNVFTACNGFTTPLYKILSSSTDSNIVNSPLSLHMILSLVSNGAAGLTLNELTSALHHDNTDSLHNEFKTLISLLNDKKNFELHIANVAYIQDGFQLVADFSSICTNIFQSSILRIDFKNNIHAADSINTWVQKATNNKISDMISSDDLDKETRIVLVNAIYFKSKWLQEFDPALTKKREFYISKVDKNLVPVMFKKTTYTHGEVPAWNARFIEIPYLNEDIVMVILLPNEIEGLQELETNFNWETLTEASKSTNTVELYLPKFKFEITTNLKDTLRKIGLNTMFEDNADFERLSSVPLKVSAVVQKVFIDVNEEGSEAAAATTVTMRLRRMIDIQEEFIVDHPFMFVIEHKPSRVPLFLGSVRKIHSSPGKDEL